MDKATYEAHVKLLHIQKDIYHRKWKDSQREADELAGIKAALKQARIVAVLGWILAVAAIVVLTGIPI
jgi:hypothetical protein